MPAAKLEEDNPWEKVDEPFSEWVVGCQMGPLRAAHPTPL